MSIAAPWNAAAEANHAHAQISFITRIALLAVSGDLHGFLPRSRIKDGKSDCGN